MPKKKGKKKKPSRLFKKYRERQRKKKQPEKDKEFPYWWFMLPPEMYPDPILRPPTGWAAEHIKKAQEPRDPWEGSKQLNEHLAIPLQRPYMRGA